MDLPRRSSQRFPLAFATAIALGLSGLVTVNAVQAEVHKCQDANGKIQYSDQPCRPAQARAYRPPPLTTIESTKLTGGRREAQEEKGIRKWLPRPLDPIRDCRERGGEFDPEFRACRLP